MGYQETYVTASTNRRFDRIVNKIRELGKDFYEQYGTYPVEIITFPKAMNGFKKGQRAIYFCGERYLQNCGGGRLLGYTDEFYEGMPESEIDKHIDDELGYHLQVYFTEDIDPVGIWKDTGKPVVVKHEEWKWEE